MEVPSVREGAFAEATATVARVLLNRAAAVISFIPYGQSAEKLLGSQRDEPALSRIVALWLTPRADSL
jgi:hypothetical protein